MSAVSPGLMHLPVAVQEAVILKHVLPLTHSILSIRLMYQSAGYVAVLKSGHSQTCLASHIFNIEYYSTEILIHIVVHVYQDSASSKNI
jgi:hypothetical protein